MWFRDEKCLPSNHHSTRRTIGFMHQLITRSETSIPAVCYARRLWCPLPWHKWVWLNWYLLTLRPAVKVNGQYYCDVLLSQQMLPAIKRFAERCLFTEQYVAHSKIGHFLCSVISQGKVVALDRWGGKLCEIACCTRSTIWANKERRKRKRTDFELVFTAVNDDGGDLLVKEHEDGGEKSRQDGQYGQPPRINWSRVHQERIPIHAHATRTQLLHSSQAAYTLIRVRVPGTGFSAWVSKVCTIL